MWVPTSINDFNYTMGHELTGLSDLRFNFTERCDWTDLFGCVWEWIPAAGGSMLKPDHTPVLNDITEWEKKIVWPDLNEARIKTCCETYMNQPFYHRDKMNYYDFGQGCTERLVAILGGYAEAMMALVEEPGACREFMCQLSRFHCEMLDKVAKYFPTDMIMYHDDWGTERDTFFGEKMMDEIVYEPSEIFFKHVKKQGIVMLFHTCGCVKRFLPYIITLGTDFLQLQQRANDIILYKEKYGDKLGFDIILSGATNEEITKNVCKWVETFGKEGGMFSTIFGGDEKMLWDIMEELYCYNREYYEKL
jgi:hypothetical protein